MIEMDDIRIVLVEYGSDAYKNTLKLRDDVLRKPLGLDISVEDVEGESSQFHIAAMDGDRVVGCVVLKPIGEARVQLRQMAVSPDLQRSGIGKGLVAFAESTAASRGFVEIILNARKTAAGFYLRLGYEVIGSEHIEVGIPHLRMSKSVSPVL